MDDFYQFMSPLEGATNNANDRPSTQPLAAQTGNAQSSSSTSSTSSRTSWSAWGVSFNKLIERGKKDMNEFVDVTRKDLSELVHTVQQEHSTTIESLSKKVGDLKTNLPPLPASVNTASAGILERVSTVVGGITHEIKEVATGVSSNPQTVAPDNTTEANVSTASVTGSTDSPSSKQNANSHGATASPNEKTVEEGSLTDTRDTMDSTASRIKPDEKPNFSLANTASLLSAGATSLTQTLSSSTKDISSSANELFKKKLPAAAEKHLGEADLFFKNTTETLKTNGLLAEQYVNKFGAGMANFLNSAVVISAPGAKEATPSRSKKMFFDRKEAMLEKLRMDPTTFTVDPMTTIADDDIIGLERYKRFLQTFNMAEYQQRTSRLLNEYPELKALMGKLVPAEVADEELFWLRYYYRLYEIEEEEKRLKKLVQGMMWCIYGMLDIMMHLCRL
ncbi:hypothetical protein BCR41DRAFT_17407 [Lobosporangium transversale]|uniref:BSD domain-containing protein n=1 Tax=Lobosporangium transversale TaxID=64571 RepID=A0A1Y2GTQ1_9FUNG|nr:hypothetical protein BCR41DRAFT_17407 [Lobosporangium transversale]ORZ22889.1 hypothetical protein BCR41DRAFT_17407 [Lobosporangium transversale]|eukprot:XP_021883443.1 hypothetical protein BCR41DRAFT_17407 [Lobosporangium transversale]